MSGDNQQETEFSLTRRVAYLLGLTLADGSLEKSRHDKFTRLTIVSIDYDLLEYASLAVEAIVGKPGSIRERKKTLGKNDKFAFRVSDKTFVTWLAQQTQEKRFIPLSIFETDKVRKTAFVAGVMDGDGWISVQEKANNGKRGGRQWKMQMGIASTEPWIFDLRRLLQQERVGVGKLQARNTKYGKRINSFTINMENYVNWGGYFRCQRKSKRLLRYRRWLKNI